MRVIPGFENYSIDENGKVFKGPNVLAACLNKKGGYLQIGLRRDGTRKMLYVHRLVALTFVNNPSPDMFNMVNHKDGNKLNNHFSNLEWTDSLGNNRHAFSSGIRVSNRRSLSEDQVRQIRKMRMETGLLVREIAAVFNVPRETVSSLVNNKTYQTVI